jgi:hypothetical protein
VGSDIGASLRRDLVRNLLVSICAQARGWEMNPAADIRKWLDDAWELKVGRHYEAQEAMRVAVEALEGSKRLLSCKVTVDTTITDYIDEELTKIAKILKGET